jgi:hypothetical protein
MEKMSQLDFYTMENGKVLLNLMKIDTYIDNIAPYICKAFSDNNSTCNLFKMGTKTNSGMEYLRKPSNGFAHIRLELPENKCLFGRFTNNITTDSVIRDKDFGVEYISEILLNTDDVPSFKNLNFVFSLNWINYKPISVRVWNWDKINKVIDLVYNESKRENNKYVLLSPSYNDFPIDGNAKEYYKKEIEDSFVDWQLFDCNENATTIKALRNGKAFETVHFDSIKAFKEKPSQDNNTFFLAHELHIPNKTYNLKKLFQRHKSETISQDNSPKKNNTLGEKDQD